jgi:hypothetical protein
MVIAWPEGSNHEGLNIELLHVDRLSFGGWKWGMDELAWPTSK